MASSSSSRQAWIQAYYANLKDPEIPAETPDVGGIQGFDSTEILGGIDGHERSCFMSSVSVHFDDLSCATPCLGLTLGTFSAFPPTAFTIFLKTAGCQESSSECNEIPYYICFATLMSSFLSRSDDLDSLQYRTRQILPTKAYD